VPRVNAEVRVARRKWPDSPHYEMNGIVLGEDEHGVWVGGRAGSLIVLPDGSERRGEHDAVWCMPHDDWYLLHFWQGHPEVDIYVDICTPAQWTDRRVSVIDLDFDVIAWTKALGGGVELVDEDEFEQHRVELDYPVDLQDNARRAAADVLARVRRGEPPFRLECAEPWLAALGVLR
jgi:uncharacterized protein